MGNEILMERQKA